MYVSGTDAGAAGLSNGKMAIVQGQQNCSRFEIDRSIRRTIEVQRKRLRSCYGCVFVHDAALYEPSEDAIS